MEDKSEHCGPNDKELDAESVMHPVIRVLVAFDNEVYRERRRGQEEDFHNGVIERQRRMPWLREEKIQVARRKHCHVQDLRLQRDPRTGV